MEQPDTPLEASVDLYKEGIDLALICDEKLAQIEGTVTVLRKTADGLFKRENYE